MYVLSFLIDLIATAVIYMLPTIIILVAHGRILKKRNAIIITILIAIFGYTVTWFVAFSSIGTGQTPRGFATITYSVLNYALLYIRSSNRNSADANEDEIYFIPDVKGAVVMDTNMQEYADVMLSETEKENDNSESTPAKSSKLSMILNVVLGVALIASLAFCFSLNGKINTLNQELKDSEAKYERAVSSRNSMQERYEEEIEELYQKYNPSALDFEKEIEKFKEEDRREVDEWNANNPDHQIDYNRQPID